MVDKNSRVALVTGAAQGIGAAIAQRLTSDGAHVVLADMNQELVVETAARLCVDGAQASAVVCDVTKASDVEEAVAQTVRKYGRLDILVNNAGVTRDNLIHRMTDDDWNLVIDTHLKGSFLATRAAQRHMVSQRYGKIIFISSRAALGNRGQTNYSAAKAGMQGMTRTLAIELGPFGINVNAIAPGHIDTEMTRAVARRTKTDYEDMVKKSIDANAIKRVGVPTDIANAVSFLSSDESSYITGQIVYVAGRPTV